jgi:hypothetical protein
MKINYLFLNIIFLKFKIKLMSILDDSKKEKYQILSNWYKFKKEKPEKNKHFQDKNKKNNIKVYIPNKNNTSSDENFILAFTEFKRVKSFRNKKEKFDLSRTNTTSNKSNALFVLNKDSDNYFFNTYDIKLENKNVNELLKPFDDCNLNEKRLYLTERIESKTLITETNISECVSEEFINKINFENLDHCQNLYDNLLFLMKRRDFKNDFLIIKIFTYDYIQFIFNDDLQLIIDNYKNILEIMKFFFYQIYLFLSILYSDIQKFEKLSFPYLNILNYSSQNFIIIKSILKSNKKPDEKDMNSIKKKNKILKSFLSIINSTFPSKKELETYLMNETKDENGIKKLICVLKENMNLSKNLKEIEKKTVEYITNKLKQYSLKKIDENKYDYTLIINLEHTLVNYFEEDENSFVQVRFGTEVFLENLSKIFEIILISNYKSEYTKTIVDTFDPNKELISNIIIKNSNEFIDLNFLGRSEKNTIIIDFTYDNFPFHKSNIIKITKFFGCEKDKELIKLEKDLIFHFKNKYEDVRNIIKSVNQNYNF